MQIPDEVSVLHAKPLSKSSLTKCSFGPLGSKLALASQDTLITVLRTPIFNNQLEMTTLQGHNSKINSLAWSKDERLLISASSDKSCIVWNMAQGKKGEKLLVLDRTVKTK